MNLVKKILCANGLSNGGLVCYRTGDEWDANGRWNVWNGGALQGAQTLLYICIDVKALIQSGFSETRFFAPTSVKLKLLKKSRVIKQGSPCLSFPVLFHVGLGKVKGCVVAPILNPYAPQVV